MKDDDLASKSREELAALVREQNSALATYKETLGRIYQEFDAKIEELSLIRRVSDALRRADDLSSLALSLVEVVISELPADVVSLMLTDPEMTLLKPVAMFEREWESPRPVDDPGPDECASLADSPLGQAVAAGHILVLDDLAGRPQGPWPKGLPKKSGSLMALPLVARQQILGAMVLGSRSPSDFGQDSARPLTIICDHAASALVNVRLIEQLGEINERLLVSELEAHQSKDYLERLLDTASDLIVIADKEGPATYANQAASEMGLSLEALSGKKFSSFFGEEARAQMILASPLRHSEELDLLLPDGSHRLVLMSTTPLPESGQVLAILRDITHRRALERQLMQAEKLASVGILAAGVAHEIGNPLSAISGYAQILDTDQEITSEDRREFSSAIAGQAERINKIIRDLLDYSRPSSHEGQAVDVNQAIEAVLNMFFTEKRLRKNELEIIRELEEGLPLVSMDRDQLQQVVLNIAMNAAQAMQDKGALTIRTGQARGLLRIRFTDTGPGIERDHLPLLFDPFFTTKPPGQGTGLGLSICERIVSQAGGRIQVESEKNQGTTFTVWLPGVK